MAGAGRALRREAADRGADGGRALPHGCLHAQFSRRPARVRRDRPGAVTEATLDGRRVLVVGAGTQPTQDPDAPIGNGRAVAVLAARRGATVLCADRDQEAAAKTADLVEQGGGQAEVLVADVADEDSCRAMVAAAAESGLNGLVLNVGIGRGRGLGETSAKDWDVVMGINLRSHFLCAREALPHMGEGDSMVFIGSTAGLRPGSRLPAYDASKAGLVGLCRPTALEGARQGNRAK